MSTDAAVRAVRLLEVVLRLMDGKPTRQRDVADLYRGTHPKTFKRDMEKLMNIARLDIVRYTHGSDQWWVMRAKLGPQPSGVQIKTCYSCGESKDVTLFGADSKTKDGHRNLCRGCKADYDHKWLERNRTRRNARQKLRAAERRRSIMRRQSKDATALDVTP